MHQTDTPIRLETSLSDSVLPVGHVDLMAALGEAECEAHTENLQTPQSAGRPRVPSKVMRIEKNRAVP
jgi:hypothetical protein